MKTIDKLKTNALAGLMTILTPEEAQQVYDHIEMLNTRVEDKEAKFVAMCDHTYQLVKMTRDLKKQLEKFGVTV